MNSNREGITRIAVHNGSTSLSWPSSLVSPSLRHGNYATISEGYRPIDPKITQRRKPKHAPKKVISLPVVATSASRAPSSRYAASKTSRSGAKARAVRQCLDGLRGRTAPSRASHGFLAWSNIAPECLVLGCCSPYFLHSIALMTFYGASSKMKRSWQLWRNKCDAWDIKDC